MTRIPKSRVDADKALGIEGFKSRALGELGSASDFTKLGPRGASYL